jgi:hypothetical protein
VTIIDAEAARRALDALAAHHTLERNVIEAAEQWLEAVESDDLDAQENAHHALIAAARARRKAGWEK